MNLKEAKAQLLEVVEGLDELSGQLNRESLITKREACEWAKKLVTQFCYDEWAEATCVYLDRHMLGDIHCIQCGAQMPVEQIDLRYCDKCHKDFEFSHRLVLMDI